MRRWLYPMLLIGLTGCGPDETVSGYIPQNVTFVLKAVNEKPVGFIANIVFQKDGAFSGQGPCNRYFGRSNVPYPWFEAGQVTSTKVACPNLKDEGRYFELLQRMSLAEISGKDLLFSNDTGQTMAFQSSP